MSEEAQKSSEKVAYDSNPFTLSFKGFGLLIDYAKGVFITMLVFGLLGFLANIPSYFPSSDSNNSSSSTINSDNTLKNNDATTAAVIGGIVLVVASVLVVVLAVGILISAAYKGFVAAGTIAAIERRKITVGEAFSEMGTRFSTLFKAELITTLKIIGGYLLFIIPGIRAQLRYQSTPYIVMSNKELGAKAAVASSKDLYRNHLMEAFGIATAGAIIPFIGGAVSASGMALSVQQLTAYSKKGLATPKTHWLNYLGLIFFLIIVFGIFAVVAIIAAIAAGQ